MHRTWIALSGRRIEVQRFRAYGWLDRLSARFERHPVSVGDAAAQSRLLVEVGKVARSTVWSQGPIQRVDVWRHPQPIRVVCTSPSVWQLEHEGTLAEADFRDPSSLRLTIDGTEAASLAHHVLSNAMQLDGWSPIHASAHASSDGKATISLGPSGAGKTCRLLQAIGQGSAPLAEDTVWARPFDSILWSTEDSLRLCPDMLPMVPPIASAAIEPMADGKYRLPMQALNCKPVATATPGDLELLLGLQPEDAPGFPPAEAPDRRWHIARQVWSSVGSAFVPEALRLKEATVAMLLALPCSVLRRTRDGRLVAV